MPGGSIPPGDDLSRLSALHGIYTDGVYAAKLASFRRMEIRLDKKWLIGGGIGAAVIAVAVVVIVLASGGSNQSGGEAPASNAEVEEVVREVEEAEAEVAEGPTNPSEPRNLEKTIIANPRSESATEEQLQRQIITNAESSDPTHKQEASCSFGSSYKRFDHYYCQGYTLGGQSGIATVEVTVDESTGAVSVEPVY